MEELCAEFSFSEEKAVQWEQKILKKLRAPTRWGYIQYGIEGYVRNRMAETKRSAYHAGYVDGYHKGLLDSKPATPPEQVLDMPIEAMGLPTKPYICLARGNCQRVRDVIELTEEDAMRIRYMGKGTHGS